MLRRPRYPRAVGRAPCPNAENAYNSPLIGECVLTGHLVRPKSCADDQRCELINPSEFVVSPY